VKSSFLCLLPSIAGLALALTSMPASGTSDSIDNAILKAETLSSTSIGTALTGTATNAFVGSRTIAVSFPVGLALGPFNRIATTFATADSAAGRSNSNSGTSDFLPRTAATKQPAPLSFSTGHGNDRIGNPDLTQTQIPESGTLVLFGLVLIGFAAIVCRRKPRQEMGSVSGQTEERSPTYRFSPAVAAGRSLSSHLDSDFDRAGHESIRVASSLSGGRAEASEEPVARAAKEPKHGALQEVADVKHARPHTIRIDPTGALRGAAKTGLAPSAEPTRRPEQRAAPGGSNS
jgi:hypothetical protein